MTEWNIFLVVVVILEFVVLITNNFINPSKKREIDTIKVIQHNTDAIKELTNEISSLTVSNSKEHEHFHRSINKLEKDVAVMKEKHDADIRVLANRKD
jgi:hypothetical protein